MSTESVIQIRHLTKIYRDFWGRKKVRALNSLSLDVSRGEVFGLLGPNGSGKTTTMKLLLGLLFPTEGEITILGRPAADVQKNERIGYLPEESYLYRFLNAEETLDFYGRLFNMSAATRRQRADALIKMVGLDGARRRQLKEYSKGMTRRIGLAQALINDPDLVLLDEPTSGLDPIGTREMKDLILRLKAQGKTVVMCSHQLADVQDVCDRIAILYAGELKLLGKVDDLLQEHDETQLLTSPFERQRRAGNRTSPCAEWRQVTQGRSSGRHPGGVVPADREAKPGASGPALHRRRSKRPKRTRASVAGSSAGLDRAARQVMVRKRRGRRLSAAVSAQIGCASRAS